MGKLLEFRARNFRSIGDNQVLSLVPSTRHSEHPENIYADGKWNALGTIAIYGANSGGKSNLLQAIRMMKRIISDSAKLSSTDTLPYDPFLLREGYDSQDTEFEITFTDNGNKYRYGFSYNRIAINKEWLCRKAAGRETSLFEREGQTIETGNGFKGNGRLVDTAIEATKDNSLFLSVCDMFNIESAKLVMDWMNNLIVIDAQHPEQFQQNTISLMKRPEFKDKISGFLASLDLDILDLAIRHDNGSDTVVAKHTVYDNQARPTKKIRQWLWDEHESSGSTKALMLSGPILWVLATGGCLVTDEIEASMHPIMTLKIIEIFQGKDSNQNRSQLIFATHDTNLLTYAKLRRDQIYFVEKNEWESSEVFSLSDFKYIGEKEGVPFTESERPDTDKEKRYIEGRYGAVPMLGSFKELMKNLLWQKEEK